MNSAIQEIVENETLSEEIEANSSTSIDKDAFVTKESSVAAKSPSQDNIEQMDCDYVLKQLLPSKNYALALKESYKLFASELPQKFWKKISLKYDIMGLEDTINKFLIHTRKGISPNLQKEVIALCTSLYFTNQDVLAQICNNSYLNLTYYCRDKIEEIFRLQKKSKKTFYRSWISFCEKLLELKPKGLLFWQEKGYYLHLIDKNLEARDANLKAIDIKKYSVRSWINLAFSEGKLGNYRESIDAYYMALSIEPNDESVLYHFVELLIKCERFEDAECVIKRNKRSLIDYPYIRRQLFCVLIMQNKFEEARFYFSKFSIGDKYDVIVELMKYSKNQKKFSLVARAYNDLLILNKQLSEDKKLSEQEVKQKKRERGKELLLWKGYYHEQAGDFESSIRAHKKYLTQYPFDIEYIVRVGTLLLKTSKNKEAIEYFERAYKIDSTYGFALYGLFCSNYLEGNYEIANRYYSQITEDYKAAIFILLSSFALRQGRLQVTKMCFTKLIERDYEKDTYLFLKHLVKYNLNSNKESYLNLIEFSYTLTKGDGSSTKKVISELSDLWRRAFGYNYAHHNLSKMFPCIDRITQFYQTHSSNQALDKERKKSQGLIDIILKANIKILFDSNKKDQALQYVLDNEDHLKEISLDELKVEILELYKYVEIILLDNIRSYKHILQYARITTSSANPIKNAASKIKETSEQFILLSKILNREVPHLSDNTALENKPYKPKQSGFVFSKDRNIMLYFKRMGKKAELDYYLSFVDPAMEDTDRILKQGSFLEKTIKNYFDFFGFDGGRAPSAAKITSKKRHFGQIIKDDYSWLDSKNQIEDELSYNQIIKENRYYEEYTSKYQKDIQVLEMELKKSHTQEDDRKCDVVTLGNYQYYNKYVKDKELPILCRKNKKKPDEEESLFDTNRVAQEENLSDMTITKMFPSANNRYVAFGIDYDGSEHFTIKIFDTKKTVLLNDLVCDVFIDYSAEDAFQIYWKSNSKGFYYKKTEIARSIYFHKLGNLCKDDIEIYSESGKTYLGFSHSASKRFFIVSMLSVCAKAQNPCDPFGKGQTNNKKTDIRNFGRKEMSQSIMIDLHSKNHEIYEMKAPKKGIIYDLDASDDYLYARINDKGNNFRIARTNINDLKFESINHDGEKQGITHHKIKKITWKEIIPQNNKYLKSFSLTKDYMILNYNDNLTYEVHIKDIDKPNPLLALNSNQAQTKEKKTKVIRFDEICTIKGYCADYNKNKIEVEYVSMPDVRRIFTYDFKRESLLLQEEDKQNTSQTIEQENIPQEYVLERILADNGNIKVPITLFYKKSLFKKDASNPLYLYAYGSYGHITPLDKSYGIKSLVDRGFIYALAHIRGGGDLGYDWSLMAKDLTKHRTYEDFIACSEYLIKEKYTKEGNIVISGRSAGGQLVTIAANKRPELYKVVIAEVPGVGEVANKYKREWGNWRKKENYCYMSSYFPYENIQGQNYPSIFTTNGITDHRVFHLEPLKWITKLRSHNKSSNPILLKTYLSKGHFPGSNKYSRIRELAEQYAFILGQFG